MERYDNIVKSSEVRKLVGQKMYQKALVILETMDLSKVKILTDLSLYAEVYMQTEHYREAEKLLLKIRSKTCSKRVIKQLIRLAIKEKQEEKAEWLYEEYVAEAPNDIDRYLLRYRIDRMKGADTDVLIDSLEKLKKYDYLEKWCYELAKLYHKIGAYEKSKKECEDLILWFGKGLIVDKAKILKSMCEKAQNNVESSMDSFCKNEKILEKQQNFEYNHKSLQDIPSKQNQNRTVTGMYTNEQLQEKFQNYLQYANMEDAIFSYFAKVKEQGTIASFFVAGGDKESRMLFSKGMAKALCEFKFCGFSRIAKIHASRLNEIELSENYDRLRDSFLVIEQASVLSQVAKAQLLTMVEALNGHIAIILQEEIELAALVLQGGSRFCALFETSFVMEERTKEMLLGQANAMFEEAEFIVSEEAQQCLTTACEQITMNIIDCERENSVRELARKVLANAERRSMQELTRRDGKIDYEGSNINRIIASDF